MLSKIRLFPDPILRKISDPIDHFDQNLISLIHQMEAIRKNQRHGIGIAAPQIGVLKQVAIVDVSARVKGAQKLILINPRITKNSKQHLLSREGCMSIPNYSGHVTRCEKIEMAWRDEKGRYLKKAFKGIEAICIQHEIDHLHGKLFLDRVRSMKRDMLPRLRKYPKV